VPINAALDQLALDARGAVLLAGEAVAHVVLGVVLVVEVVQLVEAGDHVLHDRVGHVRPAKLAAHLLFGTGFVREVVERPLLGAHVLVVPLNFLLFLGGKRAAHPKAVLHDQVLVDAERELAVHKHRGPIGIVGLLFESRNRPDCGIVSHAEKSRAPKERFGCTGALPAGFGRGLLRATGGRACFQVGWSA
jgi:hypothetical protein